MKTHLGVFSIIISYTFISLFWYLLIPKLVPEVNNLFYLVMAVISLNVIYLSRFHEHTFSRSFTHFLGNKINTLHYKDVLALTLIFILTGIGASGLLIFIESAFYYGYTVNKWSLMSEPAFASIQWSKSWLVMYGITIVIVAPITEELIFRGLILNRLLMRYRPIVAILISALIFSLAHLNKSYIGSFIHGIILSMVAIKYASLYYPMIIHGIYNATMMVLQQYFGTFYIADINKISTASYWIPEFIILLIGLSLMYHFYKKSYKIFTRKPVS